VNEHKCDLGLIGLGVMGQNLVLNMARNGFSVDAYNRTASTTKQFIAEQAAGKDIHPGYSKWCTTASSTVTYSSSLKPTTSSAGAAA
jgi:3-hydroxyisobutyrate dehydrogenase-like beta-hydroxyacid dehydrogenase